MSNMEEVAQVPDGHAQTDASRPMAAAKRSNSDNWPIARVPVEIFELITSFLTRPEVKTLRLVCREFEIKVSAQYFKNVVVPFRTELYGNLSRDEWGTPQNPSSDIFSSGMRVFESFGPHILRFALSLEIDEDGLAYPPVKPTQEAIPSFWGIYRWPHQSYHRYADLAGIEQTADETASMATALSHLTKVANLGLCCDAGLGFLIRPDTTARNASYQHPVFGTQNWRQSHRACRTTNEHVITVADFNGVSRSQGKLPAAGYMQFKLEILRQMVLDAGYDEAEIQEITNLLFQTEDTTISRIDFDERDMFNAATSSLGRAHEDDPHHDGTRGPFTFSSEDTNPHEKHKYPLIPTSLTRAQKELLLELEWAHRAMIQSYVLSMMDNARIGNLDSLTTLNIAKIPSSHVHILCRDDFWDSFPNLSNVSIGIIADWRQISKPAPGCIDDQAVSPVLAVQHAYSLLQHIGGQTGIESLHFEWICGGEFAPSSFQRNQYVLPAPFFQESEDMVARDACLRLSEQMLKLPYVKNLSLKNCWASPHVLLHMIREMALASLENVDLESVSLSGPPTNIQQAALNHTHAQAAQVQNLVNLWNGIQPNNIFALAPPAGQLGIPLLNDLMPPTTPTQDLHYPEWLGWTGLIDHFSPSIKIRRLLGERHDWSDVTRAVQLREKLEEASPFLARPQQLEPDEERYRLRCLSFKSCGYVSIDDTFVDTRAVLPPGASAIASPFSADYATLKRFMQKSKHKMLGNIISFIQPEEQSNLTNGFGMRMGWDDIYNKKVWDDALADGVECPGLGRFSGVLNSNTRNEAIWSGYESSPENPTLGTAGDTLAYL